MASVVVMPRQGNTVESCLLVGWRVREGDRVKAEDILCDVETDKAVFEIPAGYEGVVLKLLAPEGEDVPVLKPIAVIGAEGEGWESVLAAAGSSPSPSPDVKKAAVPPAGERAPGGVQAAAGTVSGAAPAPESIGDAVSGAALPRAPGVSPRAKIRAAREGLDASGLAGTGPGGRVIERDVAAVASARPFLTAAARAVLGAADGARSLGNAEGSALGGRVGLSELGRSPSGAPADEAAAPAGFPGASAAEPLKGIRKLIAERMRASLASTAQLTFNASADASRVLALRERFKTSDPALGLSGVTVGDLVLFAVSRTILRFPAANALLEDGVLRTFGSVHLALAVDTPRGLMVPVIRNADSLSLRRLSSEAKRLSAACREGRIGPDELSGGTFTVSNLGAFGIESFTPVLNAPQTAILGVNAILQRAAPGPNGQTVFEPRMGLSLTVDHQVVDGAPAARILKEIADAISGVDLLLLEGD